MGSFSTVVRSVPRRPTALSLSLFFRPPASFDSIRLPASSNRHHHIRSHHRNAARHATQDTLVKKFKEEIDAEKRKKIRLEWYLKQLLLEKEMLVKENEIEFAQAMQSIAILDAAPASLPTAVRPVATTTTLTTAPVAIPIMTTTPASASSMETSTAACLDASPSSYSSYFSIRNELPVKIEDEEDFGADVASPGPTTEDSNLDELPIFEPHEESKPLEEIFSTEWEQTHCWWDEDELSQFLAVPPSLMV